MAGYSKTVYPNFERFLEKLSKAGLTNQNTHNLILFGGGGQSKNFYQELRSNIRVEVLWSGWPGPKWLSFLSVVPSQGGIIRVIDTSVLPELFTDLSVHSVSEIIYLPKDGTKLLLEENWKANFLAVTKLYEDAFWFQAEADEDPILYECWLGKSLPQEAKSIFETLIA